MYCCYVNDILTARCNSIMQDVILLQITRGTAQICYDLGQFISVQQKLKAEKAELNDLVHFFMSVSIKHNLYYILFAINHLFLFLNAI